MAIEPLLWFCLEHQTSLADEGIALSIERRLGETILLFRTDSEAFREHFYGKSARQLACDGLFFYKYKEHPPILVFVELKGKNLAHALLQLKTAIMPVKERVEGVIGGGTRYLALVVSDGAGPTTRKAKQRDFENQTQVDLVVKSTSRGKKPVDLRAILRQVESCAPFVQSA